MGVIWSAASSSCNHGFPAMMDYVIELHSIATHNFLTVVSIHHSDLYCWLWAISIIEITSFKDPPPWGSFVCTQFQDADPWLHKSFQSTPGQVSSILIMSVATFIIFTSSNISPPWPNEEVHCNHEGRKQELFNPFTLFIARSWQYAFHIVRLCYSEPASMV